MSATLILTTDAFSCGSSNFTTDDIGKVVDVGNKVSQFRKVTKVETANKALNLFVSPFAESWITAFCLYYQPQNPMAINIVVVSGLHYELNKIGGKVFVRQCTMFEAFLKAYKEKYQMQSDISVTFSVALYKNGERRIAFKPVILTSTPNPTLYPEIKTEIINEIRPMYPSESFNWSELIGNAISDRTTLSQKAQYEAQQQSNEEMMFIYRIVYQNKTKKPLQTYSGTVKRVEFVDATFRTYFYPTILISSLSQISGTDLTLSSTGTGLCISEEGPKSVLGSLFGSKPAPGAAVSVPAAAGTTQPAETSWLQKLKFWGGRSRRQRRKNKSNTRKKNRKMYGKRVKRS